MRLFLIALCLLLSACNAGDPENLFEVPQTQESMQAQENIQPSAPRPITASEEGYYQYGNMQKNIPAGNYILYGDEVLFIAPSSGKFLLCAYEIATGKVSLLCKDATCSHDEDAENCLSNKVWGNLEQYNGKLYARNFDVASADDAISQVLELKDGRFELVLDGSSNGFCHANGNLYVRTRDNSLLAYENGSDTPRVLAEEYIDYRNTVFGHYLYGWEIAGAVSRIDLLAENPQREVLVENCDGVTDGQYIYYMDMQDSDHLYRCNMDGSNPELLIDQPVFLGSVNFDDTYLYFRLYKSVDDMFGEGSNELYRMSKADPTQVEKIAQLPEAIATVYTVPGYDLLFVETTAPGEAVDGFYPDAQDSLYVMNTDGSNITPLELPDY